MRKYISKTWRNKITAVAAGAGMAVAAFSGVQLSAYAAEGTTGVAQVIANDETGIPDQVLYQAVLEEGGHQ